MPSNDSHDIRSPDGFIARLNQMTPLAFSDAVADFTDVDRRRLSKTAQGFFKEIRKNERRDIWFFAPEPIGGMACLSRLAAALRDVARVSAWARHVIADSALSTWGSLPRDAHQILAVQLEVLLEPNGSLTEPARKPLEGLKGSSKTAKLAKQLLALTGSRSSSRWQTA